MASGLPRRCGALLARVRVRLAAACKKQRVRPLTPDLPPYLNLGPKLISGYM
jgi:hypothetical protein